MSSGNDDDRSPAEREAMHNPDYLGQRQIIEEVGAMSPDEMTDFIIKHGLQEHVIGESANNLLKETLIRKRK